MKIFINYEKEEKWLNKMAAKGMNLVGYSLGRYSFEKGTPGEYIYRLELLDELPAHDKSKEYINFMEENGIDCVDTYYRWIFFRKKATDGPFEIYSDYESRRKHYQKAANLIGGLLVVNLAAAIVNFSFMVTLNLYVSILNWVVVIVLAPVFFSYVRNIKKLKKEMELYD